MTIILKSFVLDVGMEEGGKYNIYLLDFRFAMTTTLST